MQATFIPGSEVNSDLGIVNAARVSLGKKSQLIHDHEIGEDGKITLCRVPCTNPIHWSLSQADTKLIHYLAQHNHWTPFAHARLYFEICWKSLVDQLHFYKHLLPGGFAWLEYDNADYIKGSLYSWINNLSALPSASAIETVQDSIYKHYPVAHAALYKGTHEFPSFSYASGLLEISEDVLISRQVWDLACATLLVRVPIFVARQVRTSQVGIAYSDLYVEGESFSYNEVSRRYVSDEPEFYEIQQWRVREGTRVKQGSTGIASDIVATNARRNEAMNKDLCCITYEGMLSDTIAPEQARAVLPQSMYTEFYMTGTLHRWAQWLSLRLESHVQEETRYIASRVLDELKTHFPEWSMQYFTKEWTESYLLP